ncbi:Thioredoxin [Kitasatospora sp. MMS16-BH015]|uniref:thioredoxin family protein n=1 Tax=Kitasatospora sp. MMS16-BH015 TaxID=2018025 RepID=UPI000CA2EE7B|nr:thioredoxin family protein [Kitasatospora sp. MMS16-BH015]AUG75021.1 Thioredoxin [Kitasatospora sp. MMS16-BH015]
MLDPTGLVVCAAVLAGATAFGAVRATRLGRLRRRRSDADRQLSAADLGATLGARVTLVQFSTTRCAACPPARRLLHDLATTTPGATHIEIDAETRPDLVTRFGILRTPTVLVLDPHGRLVGRASGPPRRAEVTAAIEAATAA